MTKIQIKKEIMKAIKNVFKEEPKDFFSLIRERRKKITEVYKARKRVIHQVRGAVKKFKFPNILYCHK